MHPPHVAAKTSAKKAELCWKPSLFCKLRVCSSPPAERVEHPRFPLPSVTLHSTSGEELWCSHPNQNPQDPQLSHRGLARPTPCHSVFSTLPYPCAQTSSSRPKEKSQACKKKTTLELMFSCIFTLFLFALLSDVFIGLQVCKAL